VFIYTLHDADQGGVTVCGFGSGVSEEHQVTRPDIGVIDDPLFSTQFPVQLLWNLRRRGDLHGDVVHAQEMPNKVVILPHAEPVESPG